MQRVSSPAYRAGLAVWSEAATGGEHAMECNRAGAAVLGLGSGPGACCAAAPPPRAAAVANPYVNTGLANPFACMPADNNEAENPATIRNPIITPTSGAGELRSASAPLRPTRRAGSSPLAAAAANREPNPIFSPSLSASVHGGRATVRSPPAGSSRPTSGGLSPAASAPQIRIRLPVRPVALSARTASGSGLVLASGSAPVGARVGCAAAWAPDYYPTLPTVQGTDRAGRGPAALQMRGGSGAGGSSGGIGGGGGGAQMQGVAALLGDTTGRGGSGALDQYPDGLQHVDHLLSVQRHLSQVPSLHYLAKHTWRAGAG